jgi:hypothetical protein
MTQETKSHGWEGRLAPARLEWHSISGGKPPFLTCETVLLSFSLSYFSTFVCL